MYFIVESWLGNLQPRKENHPPESRRQRAQRMRHGDLVAAYTLTDEQATWTLVELTQAAEYGVLASHTIKSQ